MPPLTKGLLAAGVPEEAIDIVEIVTMREDEGGADGYARFIDRIIASGNINAIAVKLTDIADHLRPIPDGPGAEVVARLVPRYKLARERLQGALRTRV
jgi:hypothetical protein